MARQLRHFATGLLPAALLLLGGCKAVPDLLGLAAGTASGTATVSPAVGFAVGIATSAAADEVVKWYGRSRQHAEQDALAGRVGATPLGGTGRWHIHHVIPLGNEHGDFEVVRLIPSPLTACKEVVFSVIDGEKPTSPRRLYDTDVCERSDGHWQWASAEPAVPRWGFLQ